MYFHDAHLTSQSPSQILLQLTFEPKCLEQLKLKSLDICRLLDEIVKDSVYDLSVLQAKQNLQNAIKPRETKHLTPTTAKPVNLIRAVTRLKMGKSGESNMEEVPQHVMLSCTQLFVLRLV